MAAKRISDQILFKKWFMVWPALSSLGCTRNQLFGKKQFYIFELRRVKQHYQSEIK